MYKKFRLARVWSNRELRNIAPVFQGSVINVSAGTNEDKQGSTDDKYFCNASRFWLSNYSPGSFRGYEGRKNELLINLETPIPPNLHSSFDVVFNHTTLEHVFDCVEAFKNLCLMSKDVVIIIVPFAQVEHENKDYKDYWRFTPSCIKELFKRNGYQVLYESANNHFNAATYLFYVASKHPQRWCGVILKKSLKDNAGNWIGETPTGRLKKSLKKQMFAIKKAIVRK